MSVTLRLLAQLATPLLTVASLQAQTLATGPGRDSNANDPNPDSTLAATPAPIAGITLSGYGEASYSYATKSVGGVIVGRLYDRFADQFTLNALKLAVDRPYAADKWDAGVHADLVVGQNAPVLQSSGLNIGSNGDVTQLFVTLNVPTRDGNGVQFKIGKLVTLMGLEVIETIANPNWSEGNQFVYVENFTHTGLEVGHRFSSLLDIELRVCNGWDRVVATNGNRDVMGRVGLSFGAHTSFSVLGYSGAQQAGTDAKRSGVSVLFNQKAGAASLWLQGDYGMEEANANLVDPSQDAKWVALGAWLAFDANPKVGVAVRADYLDDQQGFRTTAAFGLPATGVDHKLISATGTLNLKTWPGALVRPEVRLDHSNFAVFDGAKSQVSVALSVAYIF